MMPILLTKITVAKNKYALSYHRGHGLCLLAVAFTVAIYVSVLV